MNRKDFLDEGLRQFLRFAAAADSTGLISSAFAAEDVTTRPERSARRKPHGAPAASNDLLVVVFLRGGADALGFVPPIAGPDRAIYESARPTLKIPASGDGGLLKLDERFGIHPAAKPLHDLYLAGKVAVIHAAGLTADTRSHFDAQAFVETGTPDKKSTSSGWLSRHLRGRGLGGATFEAVAMGSLLPTSLLAFDEAVVLNSLDGFNIGGNGKIRSDEMQVLRAFYPIGGHDWLVAAGADTLGAVQRLDTLAIPPATGDYPKGEIGNRLKNLAQLTKLNLGIRAATLDMGGWDTHKNQGKGAEGHFKDQIQQLSQAVAAFYSELQKDRRSVTILIQSEFGRRVKENANQGTDHGHGGVMFVLGDHVRGGKVYGEWPGLSSEHLYERADLPVMTDYRRVVADILTERFGERKVSGIFPGYTGYRPARLI